MKGKGIKLKKIFKTIISLCVLLSMSVSTFAAVVSDNDGSAFITNKTTAKMIQPIKSP